MKETERMKRRQHKLIIKLCNIHRDCEHCPLGIIAWFTGGCDYDEYDRLVKSIATIEKELKIDYDLEAIRKQIKSYSQLRETDNKTTTK